MDGGLGVRGYAVIEQGKIGQILSAKPTDRRALIEEAAGVTKYKSRRRAAELKLDAAQQNLARVDDMIFEIDKQRVSLKRQAAKARRYRRLREELRRWEKVLFARRYRALAQPSRRRALRLSEAREREARLVAALAGRRAATRRGTRRPVGAEARAAAAREAAHARQLDAERRQQQLAFDRQQVETLAVAIECAGRRGHGPRGPSRAGARAELERAPRGGRVRPTPARAAGRRAPRRQRTAALADAQRRVQPRRAGRRRGAAAGLRELDDDRDPAQRDGSGARGRRTARRRDDAPRRRGQRPADRERPRGGAIAIGSQRRSAARCGRQSTHRRGAAAREATLASVRGGARAAAAGRARPGARGRGARGPPAIARGARGGARGIRRRRARDPRRSGRSASPMPARWPTSSRPTRPTSARSRPASATCSSPCSCSTDEAARAVSSSSARRTSGRCGFLVTGGARRRRWPRRSRRPAACWRWARCVRVTGPHAAVIARGHRRGLGGRDVRRTRPPSRAHPAPVVTTAGDVFRAGRLVWGGGRGERRGLLATKRELKELRERVSAGHEAARAVVDQLSAIDAAVAALEGDIAASGWSCTTRRRPPSGRRCRSGAPAKTSRGSRAGSSWSPPSGGERQRSVWPSRRGRARHRPPSFSTRSASATSRCASMRRSGTSRPFATSWRSCRAGWPRPRRPTRPWSSAAAAVVNEVQAPRGQRAGPRGAAEGSGRRARAQPAAALGAGCRHSRAGAQSLGDEHRALDAAREEVRLADEAVAARARALPGGPKRTRAGRAHSSMRRAPRLASSTLPAPRPKPTWPTWPTSCAEVAAAARSTTSPRTWRRSRRRAAPRPMPR